MGRFVKKEFLQKCSVSSDSQNMQNEKYLIDSGMAYLRSTKFAQNIGEKFRLETCTVAEIFLLQIL